MCDFFVDRKLTTDYRGYYNADANNPYHQEGGYYEGGDQNQGQYQDEYYNDQYYEQGGAAAGEAPQAKRRGDSEEDSETFSDFTMRSDMARATDMDYYGRGDERYNSYNESQMGGRGYRPPSSQVSYGGNRSSGASTPNYGMYFLPDNDPRSHIPPGPLTLKSLYRRKKSKTFFWI